MIDAQEILYQIALSLTFVAIGVGLVMGARKKWQFLVDPPEWLWFCYSQAFFKKTLGRKGPLLITYGVGMLGIFVGFLGLLDGVNKLFAGLGLWHYR